MKRKMLPQKCIKVIWFLICFGGNLYQVTQISLDYLEYQIVTTINVNFPDFFNVPAINVCLYETQIVNLGKLFKYKPTIKSELNFTKLTNEEIVKLLKNQLLGEKMVTQGLMAKGLTTSQRIDLTYHFNDLFTGCQLVRSDGSWDYGSNCSNLFDIVPYRFGYSVCWSFNFKLQSQFKLNLLDTYRADYVAGMLYMFSFTPLARNILAESFLSYNINHEQDRMGYYRFIFLSQLEHLINLSYDEYTNHLLPYSYTTMCREYSDLAHEYSDIDSRYSDSKSLYSGRKNISRNRIFDRGSCFESCLKNKSATVLGKNVLFPNIMAFDESVDMGSRIMTIYELLNNESLVQLKFKLSKDCDHVCKSSACSETIHIPYVRSSLVYPKSVIVTYVMQSPKMETICKPKLSLIVTLTNISSTFGFWIGLSLFNSVEIFIDLVGKIIHRKIPVQGSRKMERVVKREMSKLYHYDRGRRKVDLVNRFSPQVYDQFLLDRNPPIPL